MDCHDTQQRLSAELDGQLDATESAAVRAHLATCPACQSEQEQLAALHVELKRHCRSESLADAVANRVLNHFSAAVAPVAGRPTTLNQSSAARWRHWWGYLGSAVAGFLLALVVTSGNSKQVPEVAYQPPVTESADPLTSAVTQIESASPPTARLVKATGNISVRKPEDEEWVSLAPPEISVFTCTNDASVRTEPGVVCELETASGNVVRMNESCEIKVVSEDELELVQGQVWCKASTNSSLKVVNSQKTAAPATPTAWMLTCPTNAESLASCSPTEPLQVVAASGEVGVHTNGTEQTLSPGTFYTVSDGEVRIWESSDGVLREERWMQPLLTLSGHGNPELTRRVDALLAQVGRTKVSHLHEQDLRSLGEYGALPLLKFTMAAESAGEPQRRQLAMTILADTGPAWVVPDFIGLLEDGDAEIRVQAALGLARLTGETHGYEADAWRADAAVRSDAVAVWKSWWQSNRATWPVPPAATWEVVP